jgi:hypothetical protein
MFEGAVRMNVAMFEFLKPSDAQINDMDVCRKAAHQYAEVIEDMVPEGPDKTYLLRKLREVAMWVNVAITRHADGTPRVDQADEPPGVDTFERGKAAMASSISNALGKDTDAGS